MTDNAVVVNKLSKSYGPLLALDDISLTIPQGAFFGLLGPNGAGKTTLIGILGGLIFPDDGEAFVLGKNIISDSLWIRSQIGIVPQELVYDPFFNTREALLFQSKYYGLHHNQEWVDFLLTELGLSGKAKVNTRALSGGMKRRLMIAQALVHKPSVIVLDEPTAGVDINLRLSLWNLIRDFNRRGHTIILTTHYLEEAETLCDHLALMDKGRLVALGKTRDLLSITKKAACLKVRFSGTLPTGLGDFKKEGEVLTFQIEDYAQIESLLARLRSGGIIEELSISPPSLEDLFVRLIQ